MKRTNLVALAVLIAFLTVLLPGEAVKVRASDGELTQQIYEYIGDESNQNSVFNAAIALNDNKSSNSCVYFVSEVLRRNGIGVPRNTANTIQLVLSLTLKGWEWETDYKKLKPGDIAFTTDSTGNKKGIPSHTYVFMGWVSEGSYDYAYICDNQAKDYDNRVYHIRNISKRDTVDGKSKDAFSFFMRSN